MFWGDNISVLTKNIFQVIPTKEMSYDEKLNAISRLVIYLSLLGFLFTSSVTYIIVGIITLAGIYFYNKKKEGFKEKGSKKVSFNNFVTEEYYPVTSDNPLGNVMLTDYLENPMRKEAPPSFNPEITEAIDKKTQDISQDIHNGLDVNQLFDGLGNGIEFENLMHQFYSMPSTTIPNDQKAYSEYLYGKMSSCKNGDPIDCLKNNLRYIP
uniref:Minor capsid protein P9 transmembrane helices domain-containing protein n=1 Tax=viral metagenome TaxID=1070528 RepID=A0A6C0HT40_9ZZZZ